MLSRRAGCWAPQPLSPPNHPHPPYLSRDPTFLSPFTPYNPDVPAIQLPALGRHWMGAWGVGRQGAERAYLGGRRRSSRERVPTSVQRRPQAPSEPSGAGGPARGAARRALLALQKAARKTKAIPAGRRALGGSRSASAVGRGGEGWVDPIWGPPLLLASPWSEEAEHPAKRWWAGASQQLCAPSQQWAHPAVCTQEQGSRATAAGRALVGTRDPSRLEPWPSAGLALGQEGVSAKDVGPFRHRPLGALGRQQPAPCLVC